MNSSDPARDDLIAALRGESATIDAAVKARLRDRIALTVTAVPPARPESGIEQLATATTTAGKGSTALLAIGLAIGAGAGAAGHALMSSPAVQIVYLDRIVEVKAPPAPRAEATTAPAPEPVTEPEKRYDVKATAARTSPAPVAVQLEEAEPLQVDDGMSAELSLLDEARKALAAGDANRSLARLAAHAERYPASRLEQERAALKVKALVGAGRHAEARAEGALFRRRFPGSMLLDSVEKALESIP